MEERQYPQRFDTKQGLNDSQYCSRCIYYYIHPDLLYYFALPSVSLSSMNFSWTVLFILLCVHSAWHLVGAQ